MKIKPWVALFLLAPAFGEVTCGNTPPAKFGDVVGLVFMTILYGGGALLIREAVVRWNKGWGTLLLLGAAYGVLEEGLLCKSFFDPRWPGIEQLGVYGRAGGVNWIWSYSLTIYHAVYSIGFSILVAEMFYPAAAKQRWIKNWAVPVLAALIAVETALGWAFMPAGKTPYRPGVVLGLGGLGAMVLFMVVGWAMRKPKPRPPRRLKPIAVFAATGFLGPVVFFICMFSGPSTVLSPWVYLPLIAVIQAGYTAWLVWLTGAGRDWDVRRKVALMTGVVSSMMVLGLLIDLGKGFVLGMPIVAAAELVLMVFLARAAREWRGVPPPLPQADAI
jgi:hypothetical protein